MDRAQGLISPAESSNAIAICSDCGTAHAHVPPVEIHCLQGAAVRRCLQCGQRWTTEAAPRRVTTCADCALAFIDRDGAAARCRDCNNETYGAEDAATLGVATEAEMRAALANSWRFVGSPGTSKYLGRVALELARGIEGAPLDCAVVILAEPSVRTLALPSGTLIISEGMLQALADEAELAFVLGHELAHAATGDARRPLVRLGLRAMADDRNEAESSAWARAATDLARMGHGDRCEHDADARALAGMIKAGYDPAAARGYLQRIDRRAGRGQIELNEYVLAHPPAGLRMRRLERAVVSPGAGEERLNREVFRRMAGHTALGELRPIEPFVPATAERDSAGLMWKVAWVAAGLLLVAALLLILGL